MESIRCYICKHTTNNVLLYGEFKRQGNIQVHQFCLLLSSHLEQMGPENEGICGFLESDIRKTVERGQSSVCAYCRNNGATIFCSHINCTIKFHLPCGRRNNTSHRFFGDFKSFCYEHRIIEIMIPIHSNQVNYSYSTACAICNETVEPWPNINTLWAHCCFRNAWFHRHCMQALALAAEHFKCPVCTNDKYFQSSMIHQGIYIPSIRWEIIQCKLCQFEEILTYSEKIKSVRQVLGCSMCISTLNTGDSVSPDEPSTSSAAIDRDNNMRTSQQLSSEDIGQPGSSTAQRTTHTQTDLSVFAVPPSRVIRRNINRSVNPISTNCGPLTRSRLRASRDSVQLREKMLKQAKQKLKKISTEIDGAPSVNASPYITRSRIKDEKRNGVRKSNNLQTKKK